MVYASVPPQPLPQQHRVTQSAGGGGNRWQVAQVPVTLNYYVPIFLQLGGLKSGAAWSAAAGSYMRTDASYSVGFYRSGCTMAGCQEFRNSPTCPEYSW
jgi:hypothetical protein